MPSRNYADSLIFNWLRKSVFQIEKPYALPWGGWEKWNQETKSNRPFAYWITETLPDLLEKPAGLIVDPLFDLAYYLRNRFVRQSHIIHTKLELGKWHELETRLLHGMFNELVDFVEIEQAWHHCIWDQESRKKYKMPWWRGYWFLYWKEWRCPQAGIDYLKWCMTLDDPKLPKHDQNYSQAEHARELMILYTWWKDIRPLRKDVYEESGFAEYSDRIAAKYGELPFDPDDKKITSQERREKRNIFDRAHELERARENEDEEMMIRLIKIRRSLWT